GRTGSCCARLSQPRSGQECGSRFRRRAMTITPGPVPPWRQIHAALRAQIRDGSLKPGDRLPSITGLAQEYGVALTSVRKALDALKEEGLVVTSPMGTYVAERPDSQ